MSGYDFSGIWYEVGYGVVLALLAIGVALLCRINALMKVWEAIVMVVFAIAIIGFACEDVKHIHNPKVVCQKAADPIYMGVYI